MIQSTETAPSRNPPERPRRSRLATLRCVTTMRRSLRLRTGRRAKLEAIASRAEAGSAAHATRMMDETIGSTRRTSPAGVSVCRSGQMDSIVGMQLSRRSHARPSVMGLGSVTRVPAPRSIARAGARGHQHGAGDRHCDGHGGAQVIVASARQQCQRACQTLWLCDALRDTSHPCDLRAHTMQRRNIEPRSHATQ